MCHVLPGIRTQSLGVLLILLSFDCVQAQVPAPIKAEESRIVLIRQVPISTEVTGKLKSVSPSEEGQYVKHGDLMIEIEDELIRREVAEAEKKHNSVVEIEFAVVALAKAEVDLKQRLEANAKYKSFSDNEIRQTELEVKKSQASLAKSREDKEVLGLTLETKKAQLAQYKVYVPFDGLVTKVHRWPGQSVRPGDPVLTITDMSELRVVLKIDYKRRSEVFVGDPVEIRIDTTGKSIRADSPRFTPDEQTPNEDPGSDLFNRSGPYSPEPTFSAPDQNEVFVGTIRFIDPELLQNGGLVTLSVHADVPNRQDKYGRYLLQQGLPIEAVIIPKKREE
jgi:multidrug efflux pump subunit AcrA (membrane-fusion protein)